MPRIRTILFAVALTGLCGACKEKQGTSETDALGTVKGSVGSVAVYLPQTATKTWAKVKGTSVQRGATVWTVDDAEGRPVTYAVKASAGGPTLRVTEVVYRNPQQANWLRGFVLMHCFDWDESKHASAETLAAATTASVSAATPSSDAPPTKRAMCEM